MVTDLLTSNPLQLLGGGDQVFWTYQSGGACAVKLSNNDTPSAPPSSRAKQKAKCKTCVTQDHKTATAAAQWKCKHCKQLGSKDSYSTSQWTRRHTAGASCKTCLAHPLPERPGAAAPNCKLEDDNNKERATDEDEDEEGTGIVFEPTLRALTAPSTTDSANALLNPALLTEPHTNHLPRGHRHMPEPPHPGRAGDPEGPMPSAIRAVASPNGRGTFLTLSATGEDGHGDETADKQLTTTAAAEDEDLGAALAEAYKQLAMELEAGDADPTTEACLVVARCADDSLVYGLSEQTSVLMRRFQERVLPPELTAEGVPPLKRQGPPPATAGR